MKNFIEKVKKGYHLSFEEMKVASEEIFNEETPVKVIKEFLVALAKKGECAQEVAALATVMKSFATPLRTPRGTFMDNCGTGGDGVNTFNISTTTAFVLAGAGAELAKHGNRKVSSASGSSDVLEELGIRLDFNEAELTELLERERLAFLFAPQVHPKMKRIGEIRAEIGQPTIFNLVGPLTNPYNLTSQFTGISKKDFLMEYASVLNILGRKRAVVVSGAGGTDEASLAGQNSFVLLDHGDLIPFTLTPEDVGLQSAPLTAIRGGNAKENADLIRSILNGERGPKFDTVVFNAGIGLFADGRVKTIQEGVEKAINSILSGRALQKLEAVVAFSKETREEGLVG